ncbi:hypothetical protein HCU64_14325 [Methylobacterium sp. C25]|uniref:hypothetical protein n=1 Tax=Methylobacterium sp. C25 TaxID=2721622 RepID=UPI001F17371F|nr:hypothetical protein [Methylobacterium sp. C25]MCE4224935.1 hypothetical protein [Methylobacterium sp. C25]
MSADKPKPHPLALIDDAFLDNILETSEQDLRAELSEEGLSPDEILGGLRSMISLAEKECVQARLAKAKADLASFREADRPALPVEDLQKRRERLAAMRMRAPAATGMMMAARKGEGLSDRDNEGLLDDLADLDRLGAEKDGSDS